MGKFDIPVITIYTHMHTRKHTNTQTHTHTHTHTHILTDTRAYIGLSFQLRVALRRN